MRVATIDDVVDVFSRELHIVDPIPIWVTLGTFIADQLPGDPVWLLVVGPPGSGKTEMLNSLTGLPHVYEVSTFTEADLAADNNTSASRDNSPSHCRHDTSHNIRTGWVVTRSPTAETATSPANPAGVPIMA